MESVIIILQIVKDQFFTNNEIYIRLKRCLNNKVQNWKFYWELYEEQKNRLEQNIMEEEENYHKNYNPP
jgi:hypothetical protein